MQERVFAIIAEQLRVPAEDVTPEAHLRDDLKADSLDVVDLTIAIEEGFEVEGGSLEISEDEAEALATVQDVLNFLEGKGVS